MAASIEFKPKGATQAAAAFRQLARAGEDTTPLMGLIGAHMVTSVDHRFELQEDPEGNKWEKTHRGGAILQDSGRLRRSITSSPSRRKVRIGTNVIYARPHQFGAVIKPKNAASLAFKIGGKQIFAKQVTIPARAFLGFNSDDFTEINAIARDYLLDHLELRP